MVIGDLSERSERCNRRARIWAVKIQVVGWTFLFFFWSTAQSGHIHVIVKLGRFEVSSQFIDTSESSCSRRKSWGFYCIFTIGNLKQIRIHNEPSWQLTMIFMLTRKKMFHSLCITSIGCWLSFESLVWLFNNKAALRSMLRDHDDGFTYYAHSQRKNEMKKRFQCWDITALTSGIQPIERSSETSTNASERVFYDLHCEGKMKWISQSRQHCRQSATSFGDGFV